MLLIFDEVITFRLGYRGAQGLFNIDPDLTTLAKIIGGGFPVGAVCGHKEFMAVFDPRPGKPALPHGGTFSANPVTMRAGIAAMELLDEAAFARLNAMGEAVRSGLDDAFRRHNVPGRTVGLGSLLKIHFTDRPVRDYRSAYPTEDEAKRQAVFNRALLNRGVLAAGYGLMALSTAMTDADIRAIIDAVSGAISEVSAYRLVRYRVLIRSPIDSTLPSATAVSFNAASWPCNCSPMIRCSGPVMPIE